MNSIQATREYRSKLLNALHLAKAKLPVRDFEVVSAGLKAEIQRLDTDLENLQFRAFMGCSEGAPLFPRIIQLVQRTCAGFEMARDQKSISLEKSVVRQMPLTSRKPDWIAEPSTITMGFMFSKNA